MNKIALVTGAYKGLGLEFCRQLRTEGYTVILTAREIKKAKVAAETLNVQKYFAFPKALEVTDENQIKAIVDWVNEMYGRIGLIVNNAGVNPKDYSDKSRMEKAFYLNDLGTNLKRDV